MRGHTQGRASARKLNQTVPFLLYVVYKHFLDAGCSLASRGPDGMEKFLLPSPILLLWN